MAGNGSPLTSPLTVTLTHGGLAHTSVLPTVVIPAGKSSTTFSVSAISPGADVLIATAPGYTSVSRPITVGPGIIYSFDPINYYWPWFVVAGDSTPVSFFLTAPNFDSGVSVLAPTTFTIASSPNIQFVSGGQAITSFTIPTGQSGAQLLIKGITAGDASFTITNPDYKSFSATIVVRP
jgi:hypothetical protein